MSLGILIGNMMVRYPATDILCFPIVELIP